MNTTDALRKNQRTGLDGNQTGNIVRGLEQALKHSEKTPVVRDILEKALETAKEVNRRIVDSVCVVLASTPEQPSRNPVFDVSFDVSQGSYD